MNTKGISQAVGWVLLVGLSVTLATFIGVWMRGQSETTVEGIADDLEKSTKCDDTVLRASPVCDTICSWDGANCVVDLPGCGKITDEGDCSVAPACEWTTSCVFKPGVSCGDYGGNAANCSLAGGLIDSLNLQNKGSFSIVKIKCNGNDVDLGSDLIPEEQQVLNNCKDSSRQVVVPFVKLSDGTEFGCQSKRVVAQC